MDTTTSNLASSDLAIVADDAPGRGRRAQRDDRRSASAPWGGQAFDAVLFDLDGTLVDSADAVRRSWVTWAAQNDVAPERLLGFHGMPTLRILAELVAPEQVPAAAERLEQLEVGDVDEIVPLPGAVRALADVGHERCAIVTSCTAPLAAARIAAAGVSSPAVVVTASDVEVGKPDPEPFLLAARRLGVAPERCLVVEDAVSGLTAAQAAGMATLAVTTTYDADVLDADVVVPDLGAVRFVSMDDGVQVLRAQTGPAPRPIG